MSTAYLGRASSAVVGAELLSGIFREICWWLTESIRSPQIREKRATDSTNEAGAVLDLAVLGRPRRKQPGGERQPKAERQRRRRGGLSPPCGCGGMAGEVVHWASLRLACRGKTVIDVNPGGGNQNLQEGPKMGYLSVILGQVSRDTTYMGLEGTWASRLFLWSRPSPSHEFEVANPCHSNSVEIPDESD